ncbi:unnamed protein product [Cuscuta campestris]|uniref:Uncharacterized protein n=1 Tax=Cuscuta campestris TaxID=132261 RepID=A0A484NDZ8_9ASTE|nr:unnamed protein product [Cuscuta campestris]
MSHQGIWSERPSFSDEELSPVPSSFYRGYEAALGRPMGGASEESKSPRDTQKVMGTHTASTADGSCVKDVVQFFLKIGHSQQRYEKESRSTSKVLDEMSQPFQQRSKSIAPFGGI